MEVARSYQHLGFFFKMGLSTDFKHWEESKTVLYNEINLSLPTQVLIKITVHTLDTILFY